MSTGRTSEHAADPAGDPDRGAPARTDPTNPDPVSHNLRGESAGRDDTVPASPPATRAVDPYADPPRDDSADSADRAGGNGADRAVPDGAAAGGATPYGEASRGRIAHDAVPGGGAPRDGAPRDGAPRDGALNGGAANGGAPNGGASSSEAAREAGLARWRRRKPPAQKSKGSLLKELPVLLIVAFVLALLIKAFLVQAFFIPSGSMEPTLHGCPGCSGDRVLVNKVPYYFHDPQPGDVVVFRGPESWAPEVQVAAPGNVVQSALLWLGRAIGTAPPDEKDFVKRVVATGGQTVECCDSQGRVTVDGRPLTEPYIEFETPIEARSFGPIVVPPGRLWVMGDNRAGSADSRAHVDDGEMGTIPVDNVIGKAAVIVWPVSRLDWLGSPDIQGLSHAAGIAPAAVPYAVGLAGAVPLLAWRRRDR